VTIASAALTFGSQCVRSEARTVPIHMVVTVEARGSRRTSKSTMSALWPASTSWPPKITEDSAADHVWRPSELCRDLSENCDDQWQEVFLLFDQEVLQGTL
jgi:hypothetical protein